MSKLGPMPNYTEEEKQLGELILSHLWCGCPDRGVSGFKPNHAARVVLQSLGLQ